MTNNIGCWISHGLGDVVMTLPAISLIIEKYPDSNLILVVKSTLEKELITEVLPNIEAEFFLFKGNESSTLFKLFKKKFNVFFFFHSIPSFKFTILSLLIRSKIRIGPLHKNRVFNIFLDKEVKPNVNHKVEYYISFIEPQIFSGYNKLSIPFGIVKNNSLLKIVIAPGSGEYESHKRYPISNWAEVIKLIKISFPNYQIFLFGAKNETFLLQQIQNLLDFEIETFIPTSINNTLLFLNSSKLILSVCNGTSHLSALLQVPTISIYGPTNPSITGIIGAKTTVIRSDLKCCPCYRKGFITGCNDPICMKQIKPESIMEFVLKAINGSFFPCDHKIETKIVNQNRSIIK